LTQHRDDDDNYDDDGHDDYEDDDNDAADGIIGSRKETCVLRGKHFCWKNLSINKCFFPQEWIT
jgi:hypothetical protein